MVLGLFFLAKTADLAVRGELGLAFALTEESVMFWGEVGLGVLLPCSSRPCSRSWASSSGA